MKADPESMQMQFPDFRLNGNNQNQNTTESTPADLKRLSQVFNTAVVHTRLDGADESKELFRLMESPAFEAILGCVQSFAKDRGISETDSAKELIRTFRKIDQIWTHYLIKEGTERLKS